MFQNKHLGVGVQDVCGFWLSGRVKFVFVAACKDASVNEIEAYVRQSGRNRIDTWMTKWTFRHVLLKRAYTKNDFGHMAKDSRFGACGTKPSTIGLEVWFMKAAQPAEDVA